mmetsp:Transcript_1371/g.1735  ORF Transcript_1371/g.1735 Transcript_1371/m.1735 type:complete len:90 (+) Transcript_1371:87-356(+)
MTSKLLIHRNKFPPLWYICVQHAAGIFGAISASEKAKQLVGNKKFKTIVLEQGVEPLTKVRISGGGRCNVMHDENILPRDLVKNYPRGR